MDKHPIYPHSVVQPDRPPSSHRSGLGRNGEVCAPSWDTMHSAFATKRWHLRGVFGPGTTEVNYAHQKPCLHYRGAPTRPGTPCPSEYCCPDCHNLLVPAGRPQPGRVYRYRILLPIVKAPQTSLCTRALHIDIPDETLICTGLQYSRKLFYLI